MKSLLNIIEGLKISSKSKVSDEKSILDKNINSIDELHDVIKQYFEVSNFNVAVNDIDQSEQYWQYTPTAKIKVGANFDVIFFKNQKKSHILQFAEYEYQGYKKHFLMQLIVFNRVKTKKCNVHGVSQDNEFIEGTNLLNFIETIIQHTQENNKEDKDPDLVKLFKDL